MALQLAVLSDLRVGRIRRERRCRVGAVSEGKVEGRDAGERAKYTSREHAGHQRRRDAPVHKHEQQFGSAEERVRRRVRRTFCAAIFACRGRFGSGLLRCDRLDRARCAAAARRSGASSSEALRGLDQLSTELGRPTKKGLGEIPYCAFRRRERPGIAVRPKQRAETAKNRRQCRLPRRSSRR